VSHDGEYEWFMKLAAEHLPGLVEALGGERGADLLDLLEQEFAGDRSYEFERVLRGSGLPVELFVF
jgi:hypothetical protein